MPKTDFTANALIDGLPAGQDVFYRNRFQNLLSPTIVGEPKRRAIDALFRSCGRQTRPAKFARFGPINLKNARHADDPRPLDDASSCPAARDYSRAYLHHLVKANGSAQDRDRRATVARRAAGPGGPANECLHRQANRVAPSRGAGAWPEDSRRDASASPCL
jgi:hypothetical protein